MTMWGQLSQRRSKLTAQENGLRFLPTPGWWRSALTQAQWRPWDTQGLDVFVHLSKHSENCGHWFGRNPIDETSTRTYLFAIHSSMLSSNRNEGRELQSKEFKARLIIFVKRKLTYLDGVTSLFQCMLKIIEKLTLNLHFLYTLPRVQYIIGGNGCEPFETLLFLGQC